VLTGTLRVAVPTGKENELQHEQWDARMFVRKRVLLFLHNQTNARILHALLTRAGAVVVVAKDRDEFLRSLRSKKGSARDSPSGTPLCLPSFLSFHRLTLTR
jgi:hypothetical protein